MAWQDVRGWYEERDDDPGPGEVEMAELSCWWCGRAFVLPAPDPDRFCSPECGAKWADAASARAAKALGEYLGDNAESVRRGETEPPF